MSEALLDALRQVPQGRWFVLSATPGKFAQDDAPARAADEIERLMGEVEDLTYALKMVDDPYPLQVFPDLQKADEVYAAMRQVNRYATEQFFAETARQRGEVARRILERARAERA